MYSNFIKYAFRKPETAYLEWLLPQNKKALVRGATFTLVTVTALSYVDYFCYADAYYSSLPVPTKKPFWLDNAYRLIVVPLINLGLIFLAKSKWNKSLANLEIIAALILMVSLTGFMSTDIVHEYYTSNDFAYDVLVLVLFSQMLYGLTFRTSLFFSFAMVFTVLLYLSLDEEIPSQLYIYNFTLILLIWGSVLVGTFKLEQSKLINFKTIAQLEEAHTELLKHTTELKSKNEDLQQFAYASSHDLQEPLRTISNFVSILNKQLNDKMAEEQRLYMGLVLNSTDRMKHLIHAILDYSRIGRNRKLEAIDCNLLVNEVLADLDYALKKSNGTVEIGPLPIINGYKSELGTLFQNLISNSLKFRRKEVPPHIKVGGQTVGDDFLFTVEDNGIGIDPKYADKIFQLFSRLHNKEEFEGTGIGLTHSKKIVELHGGKIWLESCEGEGTIFYFSIPKTISINSNEKETKLHHVN